MTRSLVDRVMGSAVNSTLDADYQMTLERVVEVIRVRRNNMHQPADRRSLPILVYLGYSYTVFAFGTHSGSLTVLHLTQEVSLQQKARRLLYKAKLRTRREPTLHQRDGSFDPPRNRRGISLFHQHPPAGPKLPAPTAGEST